MKKYYLMITMAVVLVACGQNGTRVIEPVNFSNVDISDSFWAPKILTNKNVTLNVCMDQIENKTGRIKNFENAAKREGQHSGIFFDDSDVYKALEGMAYSLKNNPDPELEKKCDEWIDKMAAAQLEDGYINTFYTLTNLGNRWTNMDKHEMYCTGHLIEAAVAYYDVTGKRKLLDVAERMMSHIMSIFGPDGKRNWVAGHEEMELALVKLYRATNKPEYLAFANWLLEERGHGYGTYGPDSDKEWNKKYYQDEFPVSELSEISGHAVRSMYLFCGMADVASYTKNQSYMDALNRLWDDVVLRNMYITGGIGSSKHNEGFTEDYDLPNLEAYCETCASIGMVLWNWRMNCLTGDSKYVDIVEKCMYNGVISGVSVSGDRFFYVNPLESLGNHHRQQWYGCACCPSNICRFMPSVGNYIYGISEKAAYVNLFVGSQTTFNFGKKKLNISQETNYPWDGKIRIKVDAPTPIEKDICVRIPEWCDDWNVELDGESIQPAVEKGYAVISKRWQTGDEIIVNFDMPAKLVAADSRVKEDLGKRALQRGPIIYCIEKIDNENAYDSVSLNSNVKFDCNYDSSLLGGICKISAKLSDGGVVNYIPYYAWDNREASAMKVWLPFNE